MAQTLLNQDRSIYKNVSVIKLRTNAQHFRRTEHFKTKNKKQVLWKNLFFDYFV